MDEDSGTVTKLGILGVTSVAYVLCDVLHELGHAAATLLPLGVRALSISTIGLTTSRSSPVVAAAGPLVNLVLAAAIFLSFASALAPPWRYFAWLFGTVNLFNGTAYFVYSAILGSGDVAVVLNSTTAHWRILVAILGLLAYLSAVLVSRHALRGLVTAGILNTTDAQKCCVLTYWWGAFLVTAGAVFNPVSPWLILTSGAAVGFGAMAGLLLLPPLLSSGVDHTQPSSLSIGWPWLIAGAFAAILFVGLFGPGIRMSTSRMQHSVHGA